MARQAKVVLVGEQSPSTERVVSGLLTQSIAVDVQRQPADARGGDMPDLVLIDGSAQPDLVETVKRCRRRWPEQATPILVLGSPNTDLATMAIDAGATDAVVDALGGPLMVAHVHRAMRAGQWLRLTVDDERRRARQDVLALAAADVAVPLGALLDELESAMARTPVNKQLDELLELTGRAVEAVDRMRRMATSNGPITLESGNA